jgi:hypothetical protein
MVYAGNAVWSAGGVEIVKTSDGGMTWKSADSGLPGDALLGPLAIDPQNPATVYTATSTVFDVAIGRGIGPGDPGI